MITLPPDPYKVLGVARDAQITEIRSAHRKLVLKCHPDKIQDPALKAQKQDEFQKVQQAYELLSDDNERQKYDDQVKLAELRRMQQSKANQSAPRATPKSYTEYEIRTAEPRSSSFKSTGPSPTKSYATTFSRSWEEDTSHGPRIFEAEIKTRREGSYSEKPSRRETDKEREVREREREHRERDKDRDKEKRRRAEEAAKKAEKEAKDARRAEKRAREKARDKDIRRETEEKKRHSKPYVEAFEEESVPKSEKKKSSSSKKHEEKRERSSHREEAIPAPAPPVPQAPTDYDVNLDYAASYIEATRAKGSNGPARSATYHLRNQPPAVPTPPPAAGQSSPFPTPDEDDARRSSARNRRGSSDTIRSNRDSREKAYKKSSREVLDDQIPEVLESSSPRSYHSASHFKPTAASPVTPSSPPRHDLPRTHTMPADGYTRPVPSMSRAQTFSGYGESAAPRGRSRSRYQSQIEEEYEGDSEEDYEARKHRSSKHRSSKKKESPEPRVENVRRYHVDIGRTKAPSSYTRTVEPEADYRYYSAAGNIRVVESRPPMTPRDGSYSSGFKVKQSKAFAAGDVQYSQYYNQPAIYRDENPVVYG